MKTIQELIVQFKLVSNRDFTVPIGSTNGFYMLFEHIGPGRFTDEMPEIEMYRKTHGQTVQAAIAQENKRL